MLDGLRQGLVSSLVAQRIKRSESIRIKLQRFDWLTLSAMQDLGGCRAILKSVNNVDKLVRRYKEGSRIKHTLVDFDDYIRKPKRSGYRGIHLIYSYRSDKKKTYNGHRIEMQIRSANMHAWATAVETVDTFTKQGLKTGKGAEDWKRFFVLMSSRFALQDGMPVVPKTPANEKDLIAELKGLASKLNVVGNLTAYRTSLQAFQSTAPREMHYFVLSLEAAKSDNPTLTVWPNQRAQLKDAEMQEERLSRDSSRDVVLVAVDSLDALYKAYPNYSADTTYFIQSVQELTEA